MPVMGRFKDSAGELVETASPYGTRKYVGQLPLQQHEYAVDLVPQVSAAVKRAENNPRNHGVLSVKTSNPSKVLDDSVYNNFVRWNAAGRPGKFVDFMQRRWAPIGVKNDPKNLNKNWAPNVRKFLQQDPNVDYERLREDNIVFNQPAFRTFNV
jgi:hypothetical protein